MQPRIRSPHAQAEFFTSEQCHIIEIGNQADDPEVSVARARVEPGISTRWHRLRETTERYYILSGEGCVEVGDLPATAVGAGAYVLIPPGVRQRITNCGEEDLVFLAICSPRFRSENYEELDEAGLSTAPVRP